MEFYIKLDPSRTRPCFRVAVEPSLPREKMEELMKTMKRDMACNGFLSETEHGEYIINIQSIQDKLVGYIHKNGYKVHVL